MSHKTTMRPLMRPHELGSTNETQCIIKLRNEQPIFDVRCRAENTLSAR